MGESEGEGEILGSRVHRGGTIVGITRSSRESAKILKVPLPTIPHSPRKPGIKA
jgi:hypothetical protein